MFRSIPEAVAHYARIQPEKLCLADDRREVSYGAYWEQIRRYAGDFHRRGVRAGDRIVVEASQTIEYLAVGLAIQLNHAVFVPVEHNCAPAKIRSLCEQVRAAMAICCKALDCGAREVCTYAELDDRCRGVEPYAPESFPDATAACEILFSTGTTGKEKGIVIRHRNNVALAENVLRGVQMAGDNVEMIPSPMNHSHGLRRYYANMYNGSTVILLGSAMNMQRFFQNIERFGVTAIDLVPAALSVVLSLSRDKLAEYRDQIRYIQFGAAPMLEADKDRISALLPETRLYNFYGSTESGCTCIYDFNRPNRKANCIGRATCNAELFIVNDRFEAMDAAAGKPGLLACRGGMNMLEYWQDPAETAKVLRDGVVYTNDIAYFDSDGDVILLGRCGDVINVGGNKVSPEEIENAARQIPGVADCGVIPVDDPCKGTVPKLFVQMAAGRALNLIEIRSYLAKALEPYKIPAFIEQIAQIPRSYNGKLLRNKLKQI